MKRIGQIGKKIATEWSTWQYHMQMTNLVTTEKQSLQQIFENSGHFRPMT